MILRFSMIFLVTLSFVGCAKKYKVPACLDTKVGDIFKIKVISKGRKFGRVNKAGELDYGKVKAKYQKTHSRAKYELQADIKLLKLNDCGSVKSALIKIETFKQLDGESSGVVFKSGEEIRGVVSEGAVLYYQGERQISGKRARILGGVTGEFFATMDIDERESDRVLGLDKEREIGERWAVDPKAFGDLYKEKDPETIKNLAHMKIEAVLAGKETVNGEECLTIKFSFIVDYKGSEIQELFSGKPNLKAHSYGKVEGFTESYSLKRKRYCKNSHKIATEMKYEYTKFGLVLSDLVESETTLSYIYN